MRPVRNGAATALTCSCLLRTGRGTPGRTYTRLMSRSAELGKCPYRALSALPPVAVPGAAPAPADAAPGSGRTALHGHG
ncbi:hypothetical protein AMK21_09460 [Streptomyces sp. CB00316]|nr:hypothetical protein AMK21_09460 [Streptomyces sp. CB00316]